MNFGVFLPVSGRAAGPETLTQVARSAEAWGFDSVWAADRIVIPWTIETAYPYAEQDVFIVPPDRPFLEALTVLSYVAGRTDSIQLGVSVLVLPYRNPVFWAKIATTIDRLSNGRLQLGVGVGWMKEEFDAMGADFAGRGAVTNEQLDLLEVLLRDEHVDFEGDHYFLTDISFEPKATRPGGIPIHVGGEGAIARRRAARYAQSWFPYFVRTTAARLKEQHDHVVDMTSEFGRDSDQVALSVCRPIEVTEDPVEQDPERLRGSPEQLIEALAEYRSVGVQTMALQFMVPKFPDRMIQIERFAHEVLPTFGEEGST